MVRDFTIEYAITNPLASVPPAKNPRFGISSDGPAENRYSITIMAHSAAEAEDKIRDKKAHLDGFRVLSCRDKGKLTAEEYRNRVG